MWIICLSLGVLGAAALSYLFAKVRQIIGSRQARPYHVIVQVSGGEIHADLETYDQALDLIVSTNIDRERLR
jgi:hypothetical protein